jgi:hypothetical protein
MAFKNYSGFIGALLVITGGLSPMLHIPVVGNWNYFDIDLTLASVVFVFAGAGLLASVFSKYGMLRFCGWGVLLVIIFTLVAVYFKANNYFSFIPLKKLARALTGIIHYQWIGWAMIFAGAFIMILSGRKDKTVSLAPSAAGEGGG